MTMVNGEFLFKDKRVLTMNESKVYKEVEAIQRKLQETVSD